MVRHEPTYPESLPRLENPRGPEQKSLRSSEEIMDPSSSFMIPPPAQPSSIHVAEVHWFSDVITIRINARASTEQAGEWIRDSGSVSPNLYRP